MERNRFVAALADAVFIAHASPGSKTEKFYKEWLKWGKLLYTLESEANANLISMGAKIITLEELGTLPNF